MCDTGHIHPKSGERLHVEVVRPPDGDSKEHSWRPAGRRRLPCRLLTVCEGWTGNLTKQKLLSACPPPPHPPLRLKPKIMFLCFQSKFNKPVWLTCSIWKVLGFEFITNDVLLMRDVHKRVLNGASALLHNSCQ